jgi:hypothetical protein
VDILAPERMFESPVVGDVRALWEESRGCRFR